MDGEKIKTYLKTYQYAPPLTDERYNECFMAFKKISSEWKSMLTWLESNLLTCTSPKQTLSVLSVGSGSGDFDLQLIQSLSNLKPKTIEYVALEPNIIHCQELKATIAERSFPDVHFEIHPIPFEEYNQKRSFDLVHFTHSLYYIPNREKAILHALDLTGSRGPVLIFHHTPIGINQIQRMFLRRIKGNENEMFSSREIQNILDSHKIVYHLDIVDSCLDISKCFNEGSSEGVNLLSFFLECEAGCLPSSMRQDILDSIRSLPSYEIESGLLSHPVAIFLIQGSIFSICNSRGRRTLP